LTNRDLFLQTGFLQGGVTATTDLGLVLLKTVEQATFAGLDFATVTVQVVAALTDGI